MKKIKITAFILLIAISCTALLSCGSVVAVDDVRFTAVTQDTSGKQTLLKGAVTGEVKGTKEAPPTVLDAVVAILEQNEIKYKLSSDGTSIVSIAGKSETTRAGYTYVWEYTINGEAPDKQRAHEIEVKEGDVIVYYLIPQKDESSSDTTTDTPDGADTEAVSDTSSES